MLLIMKMALLKLEVKLEAAKCMEADNYVFMFICILKCKI